MPVESAQAKLLGIFLQSFKIPILHIPVGLITVNASTMAKNAHEYMAFAKKIILTAIYSQGLSLERL